MEGKERSVKKERQRDNKKVRNRRTVGEEKAQPESLKEALPEYRKASILKCVHFFPSLRRSHEEENIELSHRLVFYCKSLAS